MVSPWVRVFMAVTMPPSFLILTVLSLLREQYGQAAWSGIGFVFSSVIIIRHYLFRPHDQAWPNPH